MRPGKRDVIQGSVAALVALCCGLVSATTDATCVTGDVGSKTTCAFALLDPSKGDPAVSVTFQSDAVLLRRLALRGVRRVW